MNNFNKSLLSIALTATLAMASTTTMAYPLFSINPTNTGVVGTTGTKVGDRLVGGYNEVVTLNADNTFNASIFWSNAGTLYNTPGPTNPPLSLGLWLTDQFNGTYSTSAGVTTFSPNGSTSNSDGIALHIYYTSGIDSMSAGTNPINGNTLFTPIFYDPSSNPISSPISTLIATGQEFATPPYSGTANGASGNSFGKGSFSLGTSITLLAANHYFVTPNPFYNESFQTGQYNSLNLVGTFNPSGSNTFISDGSADIVFNQSVPEPASLALVGLGLLSLSVVRRKKQSNALKDA